MYPDKMNWMNACVFLILSIAVTQVHSCSRETDCQANECCIVSSAKASRGSCKKLAAYGQPCTRPEKQNGGRYTRFCPCGDGLTCRLKERLEAKFGGVDVFLFMDKCFKAGAAGAPKDVVIKEKKFAGGEIIEEDLEDR